MVVSADSPPPDPDELDRSSKESIEKAHDLVQGLRSVQEHENAILGEDDQPLAG
jgi:hypothetical protein